MTDSTYTPDEIAKMFKISKHTVYELIKRGELQAFKIGNKMRINPEEVERFKSSSQAHQNHTSNAVIAQPSLSTTIRLTGSHDFLVEQLTKYVSKKTNLQLQPTYIGSLEGLMMLYRGAADVAAVHLLDPNSKQYNIPFIKQLFVHEKISVIGLASREQGFIVAKGNPKVITSFGDLTRRDVSFVNRQKGSGTRFLLDAFLAQHEISPKEVKGYDNEEWNHLSTASHISRGSADVGFGIKSAADQLGLDFIPVTEEQFDLVFRWTDDNEKDLTSLYELICTEEFKTQITKIPGYKLKGLGEIKYTTIN
ncbi:helix-turn-helix domain-containing protein [Anaerobacillus alkaliphilus]|uniref:Helix-turn-helix domain-containing protein n=1 Tax=Anaerobacillus alkaliphilus TaxID=1548597 RepID=A0A4Q0VMR8_9BACI|nr:substrate-binding domain-containing protein [Anaerobacillus alkaliphilus]RXI96697.1 helix-turn-helix domain-containing protein [Anaerobacillus alkaliphilus]